MELVHQVISKDGLEIPLPIIQQYGLRPGDRVTLELGPDGIFMAIPINDPHEIEGRALRLTLKYLGDAVTVKAERDTSVFNQGGWRVHVFGVEMTTPIGHLVYTRTGKPLPEFSTSFEEMRRIGIEFALTQ
jgi:hypothetical protein